MNKKKIIIVNNNLNIGGVQKSLVSLLKEIKEQFDVTLFLFKADGEYISEIPKNIKIVQCKSLFKCFGFSKDESKISKRLYFERNLLALIAKIFGRNIVIRICNFSQKRIEDHYDIAISYLHSGSNKSFYGGCNEFVLDNIDADKKITFLHGDYTQCGANTERTNKLYHKFDLVAACSEGCRRSFLSVLPDMRDKCKVIPNCHDFDSYCKRSKEGTVIYKQDCINIISIARLSVEKGIERALKSISYIKNKKISIMYHIIGDGDEREKIQKIIKNLDLENNVVLYGNQVNPYRFIPNADLLLITSYQEAAPLVIDEAKFFGVPVLSTKTISAIEMIVDRKIGWVCENDQCSIDNLLLKVTKNIEILKNKKKEILLLDNNNKDAITAFQKIME